MARMRKELAGAGKQPSAHPQIDNLIIIDRQVPNFQTYIFI